MTSDIESMATITDEYPSVLCEHHEDKELEKTVNFLNPDLNYHHFGCDISKLVALFHRGIPTPYKRFEYNLSKKVLLHRIHSQRPAANIEHILTLEELKDTMEFVDRCFFFNLVMIPGVTRVRLGPDICPVGILGLTTRADYDNVNGYYRTVNIDIATRCFLSDGSEYERPTTWSLLETAIHEMTHVFLRYACEQDSCGLRTESQRLNKWTEWPGREHGPAFRNVNGSIIKTIQNWHPDLHDFGRRDLRDMRRYGRKQDAACALVSRKTIKAPDSLLPRDEIAVKRPRPAFSLSQEYERSSSFRGCTG